MSDGLFVDPGALEGAVLGAAAAGQAVIDAADSLDAARDAMCQALTWTIGHDTRYKANTFARQWREEFLILGESLTAYNETILEIAASYRNHETALADAVDGCGT